jgi:TRAP-type mannitol/chloroaromatic compound transport system permease small subunit
VERFLLFVDRLSMWTGKIFAWCILILTFAVSYEVLVRYAFRAPTAWAYDVSYIMYGALFLMAGAYTVSRDGHVRGDVVYRLWSPRTQGAVDLVLYILFYFPAVLALIYSGYNFAHLAWRFGETSVYSPASIPIWQLKALIPVAGVVLALQGISEVVRCWRAIRSNEWPPRYQDVEEMESAILHAHEDEMRMRAEHQPDAQRTGAGADR